MDTGTKLQNRITRWAMYRDIRRQIRRRQVTAAPRILSVSGVVPFVDEFREPSVEERGYPDFDIQSMDVASETYDVVVADQVLEHVPDPWTAVHEVRRVLRKGGLAILTTCSFNQWHFVEGKYGDYWRFMPDGMRVLMRDFSDVHIKTWGSREAICEATRGRRPQVESEKERALARRNEERWPFVIWTVAQKAPSSGGRRSVR